MTSTFSQTTVLMQQNINHTVDLIVVEYNKTELLLNTLVWVENEENPLLKKRL